MFVSSHTVFDRDDVGTMQSAYDAVCGTCPLDEGTKDLVACVITRLARRGDLRFERLVGAASYIAEQCAVQSAHGRRFVWRPV